MTRKKGKFLTFMFSLIPGGGQMYMGFMKEGVSLMGAFFLTMFLESWLSIGALLYLLPVLWFYSFFDSMNKSSLDDEEFYCLEDHYLFIENLDRDNVIHFIKKYNVLAAIVLIVLGASILFNCFVRMIGTYFNFWIIQELANFVRWFVPQTIFACFIIWVGVKLISWKKKSIEDGKAG
ncbi:MAG: hypothetical protein J6B85_09400 [Lachnospiraceae bacterium]|nr:hypothetical protein [Lachnospiraceae bacterium]